MDLYEFIAGNKQSNDEITLSIKDYFMLPFIIVNHIDSSRDYTRGLTHFLGIVYKDEPKDLIYYGLIAKTINKVFNT